MGDKIRVALYDVNWGATCQQLQLNIWGQNNIIPLSFFSVAKRLGGVALVALANDECVGFIISLPCVFNQQLSQWSFRLAVSNDYQNLGIGTLLKRQQQQQLLSQGVQTLMWSFDPLNFKNAHLNLNKLKAKIVDFDAHMYASDAGQRCIVEWNLDGIPSTNFSQLQSIQSITGDEVELLPSAENTHSLPDVIRVTLNHDSDVDKLTEQMNQLLMSGYVGVSFVEYQENGHYVFVKR